MKKNRLFALSVAAMLIASAVLLAGCGESNKYYGEILELYNAANESGSGEYSARLEVVFGNSSGNFSSSITEERKQTNAGGKTSFVSEYLINQEGEETALTLFSDGTNNYFPLGSGKFFKEPVSAEQDNSFSVVPPPSEQAMKCEKSEGETTVYTYITSEENVRNFCLSRLADLYDMEKLFGDGFLKKVHVEDIRVSYSAAGDSIVKCGFDAALEIDGTSINAVYTVECSFKETPSVKFPVEDLDGIKSFNDYLDTLYSSDANEKWKNADWSLLFGGKTPAGFDPSSFDFEGYEGKLDWIGFLKSFEDTEE